MDQPARTTETAGARTIPTREVSTGPDRTSTITFNRIGDGTANRSNAADRLASVRPQGVEPGDRDEQYLEQYEVLLITDAGTVPAARLGFSITPETNETRITYREGLLVPRHAPTSTADRANRIHADHVRRAVVGLAVDRADSFGTNGTVIECGVDSALVDTLRLSPNFHRMIDPLVPDGMVGFRYDPMPTTAR
jgi:hypothetical protein